MSKNWYKEAEKKLSPGEEIHKSYPGSLNGKNGYLIVTSKRLIFEHVKGFFSKTYSNILDIQLSEIQDLKNVGRYKLEIHENGRKHNLDTYEITSGIVMRGINEIKEKSVEKMVA
jgi:hypothetical protein